MALNGSVASAEPGLIGFDDDSALSADQANQYAAQGYRFCVRYVSRDATSRAKHQSNGTPDLSEDEAAAILASGMAVMAVQHVQEPGWSPSAGLGTSYGENAAAFAAAAGLPPGVDLWLDLEGVAAGGAAADIIAYCNTWFRQVTGAGFTPGLYVGAQALLTPNQLFFDLITHHYWRAGGNIPAVSHRGYQLIQNIANPGTPQEFDRDVTQNDAYGGTVLWLAPN